jgi:hypothetical protein
VEEVIMAGRVVCLLLAAVVGCVFLISCGEPHGASVDEAVVDEASADGADADGPLVDEAKEFVGLLAAGDFEGAAERFDDTMTAAVPPSDLEKAWQGLSDLGEYKGQTGVKTARESGFDVVYVTCEFTDGSTAVKVVFDAERRVAGLWFVPPG